ncbi:hypothetical protein KO481_33495 [Nocardia sp. NEAU-G5]|uniref:Uncharacterized protein n=1 Tax=Nocardia albiluteola TaxID=2842303 RepID=A0ABS6B7Y6_9NOCA|nr:hypothetical protein [Nocardia albiluteola]MBU3066424.1 hypothetical protein [Nocardia albiluteola]
MKRNDIRPIALGGAAGLTAFAAMLAGSFVLIEFDLWDTVAEQWARHRLTPAERAESDRIRAERAERDRRNLAIVDQAERDRETHDAEVRNGFRPELLNTARAVTTMGELTVPELVAEIHFADMQLYRRPVSPWLHDWHGHREALLHEFIESRNSWLARARVSRTERLRLDIAAEQIEQAPFRPTSGPRYRLAPELLTGTTDAGALSAGPATNGHTYPIFEGPNGETFGNPTTTKE